MSDIVFFGPSPSVGLWCAHEARDGGLFGRTSLIPDAEVQRLQAALEAGEL